MFMANFVASPSHTMMYSVKGSGSINVASDKVVGRGEIHNQKRRTRTERRTYRVMREKEVLNDDESHPKRRVKQKIERSGLDRYNHY
jgi:hypothetical protein